MTDKERFSDESGFFEIDESEDVGEKIVYVDDDLLMIKSAVDISGITLYDLDVLGDGDLELGLIRMLSAIQIPEGKFPVELELPQDPDLPH